MDYDLDGRISSGEFRVTLDLMGLVMTDDEFVKLWAHFDVDGSGELNYAEFNNKVGAMLHPPITRHVINRPQTPRVRQVNARKAAQGLKKRMANLADAFKMIDSDGSGRISHAEFIQALRHVGLTKISHDESYEMMVKVSLKVQVRTYNFREMPFFAVQRRRGYGRRHIFPPVQESHGIILERYGCSLRLPIASKGDSLRLHSC